MNRRGRGRGDPGLRNGQVLRAGVSNSGSQGALFFLSEVGVCQHPSPLLNLSKSRYRVPRGTLIVKEPPSCPFLPTAHQEAVHSAPALAPAAGCCF